MASPAASALVPSLARRIGPLRPNDHRQAGTCREHPLLLLHQDGTLPIEDLDHKRMSIEDVVNVTGSVRTDSLS